MVDRGPVRHVHPLGALRPARAPRMGQEPGAHTDEDYPKYFDRFDPDLYNPREWARAARKAGMKYFVVTTKHHDGFCLWDSKLTDYKATRTPYGKDLIQPLVEAMRAEGLRVGFYHSLLDWHHPDYTLDVHHPMCDDTAFVETAADRDLAKYDDYLFGQVRELLTEYGRIDCLFLDFSFPGPDGKGRNDWESEKLLKMIRDLQPGIIVNDRLDLLDVPGGWDYRTPEQFMPREWVRSTAVPCPGRRARRSPAHGAMTATKGLYRVCIGRSNGQRFKPCHASRARVPRVSARCLLP